MAVPKQKQSKARTRKRRSSRSLEAKQLVKCSHCGKMKLNHTICDNCGYYKGRQVINVLLKKKPKSKK